MTYSNNNDQLKQITSISHYIRTPPKQITLISHLKNSTNHRSTNQSQKLQKTNNTSLCHLWSLQVSIYDNASTAWSLTIISLPQRLYELLVLAQQPNTSWLNFYFILYFNIHFNFNYDQHILSTSSNLHPNTTTNQRKWVQGYPGRLAASQQANRAPQTNLKEPKVTGLPRKTCMKDKPIGLLPKNLLQTKTIKKQSQTNQNYPRINLETAKTIKPSRKSRPTAQVRQGTSTI